MLISKLKNMQTVFAKYEHTKPGFPKVKLKFVEDRTVALGYTDPYLTVKGEIKPWSWEYGQEVLSYGQLKSELKRFEEYAVATYRDDETVQG